jgi:hypothetical protein
MGCYECRQVKTDLQNLVKELREVLPPCEGCGERVLGWIAPSGGFAPEAWATLRERGIDPANGHKASCKVMLEKKAAAERERRRRW